MDKKNYKEVNTGDEFVRMWPEKDAKEGESIEGRYLGSSVRNSKKTGDDYTVHVIEVEGEGKVGVWGSSVINSKLDNVAEGKMVSIEYLGIETSKKGREFKNFWVGMGVDDPNEQVVK